MSLVDEFRKIFDGADFMNVDTKFCTYPASKHTIDTGYAYVVPVPGLTRANVTLTLIDSGKAFRIQGDAPPPGSSHIAAGLWRFTPASWTFRVPDDADVETMKARVENGLMKITIDRWAVHPSQIPVRTIPVE